MTWPSFAPLEASCWVPELLRRWIKQELPGVPKPHPPGPCCSPWTRPFLTLRVPPGRRLAMFGKYTYVVLLVIKHSWDYAFIQLQIHVYSFRNYLLSAPESDLLYFTHILAVLLDALM